MFDTIRSSLWINGLLWMIFKSTIAILLAIIWPIISHAGDLSTPVVSDRTSGINTSASLFIPLARPLVLRSDALSGANAATLRAFAQMGADPRTGIPYDWHGFPKLSSFFDIQLSPDQFRSPLYGKIANEKLLAEIKRDPGLRRQYSARDIELLESGRNPQGKVWHHDPQKKGRLQLVDEGEHSVDHVGGDKVWGRIDEKAFAKATAVRWGSVALFDIAISSIGLACADELDLDHFMQATSRSAAGGAAAFGTEYLLVKLMPQTVGFPPGWFGGMRILFGSPAAWAASLSYATTRALVDYCWDSRRLRQLQIQEQACRIAEGKARWQRIESAVQVNTGALKDLLADQNTKRGVKQ